MFLTGGNLGFREEAVPGIFGQGREGPEVHVRQR